MPALFLLFMLLVLVVLGWGLLLERLVRCFVAKEDFAQCGVAEAGLLGFPALLGVACLVHWVTPLDPAVNTGISTIGAVALLLGGNGMLRGSDERPVTAIALATIVVPTAFLLQLGASVDYDALLYHVSFLKWLTHEPVALGLGNLHGRLAFDSAWLILSSVFAPPGTALRGAFMADAVLFVFAALLLMKHLLGRGAFRCSPSASVFALALLASLLLSMPAFYFATTTNTDRNAGLLVLLAFFLALRHIDRHRSSGGGEPSMQGRDALLLFAVIAMAVLVKVSSLPVGLLLLVPAASVRLRRAPARSVLAGATTATAAASLWMSRNIALSGCLVYPVPFTCVDRLPWSVGSAAARIEAQVTVAWARKHGPDYMSSIGNWGWLSGWAAQTVTHPLVLSLGRVACVTVPVTLAGAAASRLLRRQRAFPRAPTGVALAEALVVGSAVLGCLFWFLSAPAPRFGWAFLLALLLTPMVLALRPLAALQERGFGLTAASGPVAAVLLLLFAAVANQIWHGPLRRHPPAWQSWPAIDEISYRPVETSQGLTVSTPVGTDQCGAGPLVCSPNIPPGLRLGAFHHFPMFTVRE